MISDLRRRGNLTKPGEKDVPLRVGTKNAEFTSHRDLGQNSQDKEGSNKANSAAAAALLCVWVGLLHTRWNNFLGNNSCTYPWGRERGRTWGWLFSRRYFQSSSGSNLYRSVLFISTGLKLAQLLKFIFWLMCWVMWHVVLFIVIHLLFPV